MWGDSWLMYILELADQPRTVKNQAHTKILESVDDLEEIIPERIKKSQ